MKKGFSQSNIVYKDFIRIAWLMGLGLFLLFLDFATKAYVFQVISFHDACTGVHCASIPVFINFIGIDFLITLAINKGAAWGMFADFQIVLLILRILVIFALFIYLFFMNHKRSFDIPLVLILAGALGNIVDFFLYGFVIDFLHFNLWGYHFPVFNFADTCITIGVAWISVLSLLKGKNTTPQPT